MTSTNEKDASPKYIFTHYMPKQSKKAAHPKLTVYRPLPKKLRLLKEESVTHGFQTRIKVDSTADRSTNPVYCGVLDNGQSTSVQITNKNYQTILAENASTAKHRVPSRIRANNRSSPSEIELELTHCMVDPSSPVPSLSSHRQDWDSKYSTRVPFNPLLDLPHTTDLPFLPDTSTSLPPAMYSQAIYHERYRSDSNNMCYWQEAHYLYGAQYTANQDFVRNHGHQTVIPDLEPMGASSFQLETLLLPGPSSAYATHCTPTQIYNRYNHQEMSQRSAPSQSFNPLFNYPLCFSPHELSALSELDTTPLNPTSWTVAEEPLSFELKIPACQSQVEYSNVPSRSNNYGQLK